MYYRDSAVPSRAASMAADSIPLEQTGACMSIHACDSKWISPLQKGNGSHESHPSHSRWKFLPMTAHRTLPIWREGQWESKATVSVRREEKRRAACLRKWGVSVWETERERERERDRERQREREAYWGDPAAPRYLATALHMLTDLLATIIRVYITLLCSALLCSALHCTGSSCNCLLHLRSPINMTQPYTWLQNVTFVICFDPGLDRDQRASAFSSLACTQRAATTSQAIVRSNQAAFYLTEKTLFPFNWRSVILKIIWHAKRCLGVGTVAHCAIWLVRK